MWMRTDDVRGLGRALGMWFDTAYPFGVEQASGNHEFPPAPLVVFVRSPHRLRSLYLDDITGF